MFNVFKPHQYVPVEESKKIHFIPPAGNPSEAPAENQEIDPFAGRQQEMEELKSRILRDAEAAAEQQIQAAAQETANLRAAAQQEIEAWWQEKRSQDEQWIDQARQTGYEEGYRTGKAEAEAKVREECAAMLEEGRSIVEQAIQAKQQIIQESEPFLIELASGIAEKIIAHQLTLQPEWVLELVRKTLSRRREKGIITLCVSPSYFAFMQNARDELLYSIDSQAELEIIPDATVHDHGCVIRSEFGSIDARIDTQLDEIKTVLRQIAEQSEEEPVHD